MAQITLQFLVQKLEAVALLVHPSFDIWQKSDLEGDSSFIDRMVPGPLFPSKMHLQSNRTRSNCQICM